jgi:hypothetical protein
MRQRGQQRVNVFAVHRCKVSCHKINLALFVHFADLLCGVCVGAQSLFSCPVARPFLKWQLDIKA